MSDARLAAVPDRGDLPLVEPAVTVMYDPRKHEWRGNGWRHHVVSYGLTSDGEAFSRCSEPQCDYNERRP